MHIYAGIDEAGYGPMFGPLVIGRAVFGIETNSSDPHPPPSHPATPSPTHPATPSPSHSFSPHAPPPDLWQLLKKGICKELKDKRGRVAVNDSKKVHTSAAGIRHLETGVLSLAAAAPLSCKPANVAELLDALGETDHRDLTRLPWYQPTDEEPWDALPAAGDAGQLAIARSLVARTADEAGVRVLDLGAAVIFEDRFNQLVAATRSKAAASFHFVARHLSAIWSRFGQHHPTVVVDRQGGRTRYRELLQETFPGARLAVLEETPAESSYQVAEIGNPKSRRAITVRFLVEADSLHLPTALASMIAKYTRELLMGRFQRWFTRKAPQVAPTAGYASDAKRFWEEIQPLLPELAIDAGRLKRNS